LKKYSTDDAAVYLPVSLADDAAVYLPVSLADDAAA
jgi:hypothetical protein